MLAARHTARGPCFALAAPLLRARDEALLRPWHARPRAAAAGEEQRKKKGSMCRLQVGPTRQEATSASSVAKPLSKTAPGG